MVASAPAVTLTPIAPFDARPILAYYQRSPLEPLDAVVDGAWRRAVRLQGQPVLFEVASHGTADEPRLTVQVLAAKAPPPAPLPIAMERGRPGTGGLGSGLDRAGTWKPAPTGTDVGAGFQQPSQASPDPNLPRSLQQLPAAGPDPNLPRHLLPLAAEAVARWWQLDRDPAELDAIAAADPTLGALLARLHGARSPLMPSPFECLVWAILGQQITVAFAYKLKRALVGRYGDTIEHEGRTYWLFPEPARLAEADPTELRELQFSRQKSEYVRGLAALVAEDRIDWDELTQLPSEAAIKVLTGLRGVGRWTAEYVLMRGLGHPDVIPAADVGLQAAIGRAYGLGRKATESEVRTIAERWVPRRSYAAFAWWWSLSADRGTPPP